MYKIAIFQKTLNELFEIFNYTNYKYQSLYNLFLSEYLFNNKQVSICFILYDSYICDAFNARIKANREYHYFRFNNQVCIDIAFIQFSRFSLGLFQSLHYTDKTHKFRASFSLISYTFLILQFIVIFIPKSSCKDSSHVLNYFAIEFFHI